MVFVDINRSIFKSLQDDLLDRRATILVGARQVGKTYLMRKLRDVAERRGLATRFFDLEQPSDSRLFLRTEADIVKTLAEVPGVVFIDEFHYLRNASQIIKAVHDSGAPVKVVASGSSALEMHRHLRESLAGRKIVRRVHPCSFAELRSSDPSSELDRYLIFGGMPGLVHMPDDARRKELLADILQSYVLKDIKGLVREENIRAFNVLAYLLAERQGSLVSVAGLAREVGVTPRTAEAYLETMAQTYVAWPVHSYSSNLGNELRKSRKVYLYDLGIRNALLRDFRSAGDRPDQGAIVESFVFLELARRASAEVDIKFWRTKAGDEVDFVWVDNRVPIPIEVKAGDAAGSVPAGLRAFLRRYPQTPLAFVLHGGPSSEIIVGGVPVRFRPWASATDLPDEIAAR